MSRKLYPQDFLTEIDKNKQAAEDKIKKLRKTLKKYPDKAIEIVKKISMVEMEAASSDFNPNNNITDSRGIIHFAFPNPGLQCYANSLMQMLLHIPEFKARVLSIIDEQEPTEFARNIRELIQRLDDIQVPERFTEDIQTEIRVRLLAFSPLDQGEQQDLMELFQGYINTNLLLMPPVNEFNVRFDDNMTSNILVHVDDPERLNLKTYIEDAFSFDGQYTLPNDNRVLMLYLPRAYNPDRVGDEDADPELAAAIALSLADNKYTGKNKSKSKKVEAVVLGQKNMVPVKMDENIMIGGKTYELVSFTEHLGERVNSGHYVCWCKIDGNWVIFNDGRMPEIDTPELNANMDATLFAYRLVDAAAAAAQEVVVEPPAEVARSQKSSRVSAKIKKAIDKDAQIAQDEEIAKLMHERKIRKTKKLQEKMEKSEKLAASLHRKENRATRKLQEETKKDEKLARELADRELAQAIQEEEDAKAAAEWDWGGGRRKTMRKKYKNKGRSKIRK